MIKVSLNVFYAKTKDNIFWFKFFRLSLVRNVSHYLIKKRVSRLISSDCGSRVIISHPRCLNSSKGKSNTYPLAVNLKIYP